MSAWVVSSHHIDLLVSAAIDRGVSGKLAPDGTLQKVTESNAQAFGLMLWTENVPSVVYRYNLPGTEEEQNYRLALASYSFRYYPGIRAAAAAKALACFDYQSCECADYRDTAAAFFVRQLTEIIGHEPEGYGREPWGFDTEAQVTDAQGGVQ
jgi:hypothetical protein